MKPLILLVDSNPRNVDLLGKFLSKEGYQVLGTNDLQEFEQALNEPAEISLALVDIAGFDRQIWGLCQQLQARSIPFFVIYTSLKCNAATGKFRAGCKEYVGETFSR